MSGDLEAHLPARPSWRCQACGAAWPCSPAKLRLLAEYKDDKPALMVYLVTLREEAAEQLAELDSGTPPADLHKRFTDWVPVRPSK
ncbi:flavin reductase [Micromonospora craterilacus]|uniref:Flavin reductase n=1 Tax=Micromonospora craterilacus TaxID=1655439 RepID=A0A2W2EIZ3_9ACTN|nr:flavin reductase [Micromonospora craterilacus]PZG22313.1 flavin reductase [Micromonospora craterilacus]